MGCPNCKAEIAQLHDLRRDLAAKVARARGVEGADLKYARVR